MRRWLTGALLVVPLWLAAQTAGVPAKGKYVFFSSVDRSDAESRINHLAAQGYRLIELQRSVAKALVVVMGEQSGTEASRYEYKLLDAAWRQEYWRQKMIDKLLKEHGAEGYRCVRGSLLWMDPDAWAAQVNGIAVVMERSIGSSERFEYKVLRTTLSYNPGKELKSAGKEGFELILNYPFVNERLLLFERRTPPAAGEIVHPVEILNLTPKEAPAKIEKAYQRGLDISLLSSGYSPEQFELVLAPSQGAGQVQFVLWQVKRGKDDAVPPVDAQWVELEKQLDEAAAAGFEISARPMFISSSEYMKRFEGSVLAPMKRMSGKAPVSYRVLQRATLPELAKTVNDSASEGWRLMPGMLYGDSLVILEKPAEELR